MLNTQSSCLAVRTATRRLWLLIDAKFPHEDYEKLIDASERGTWKRPKLPPKRLRCVFVHRFSPPAQDMPVKGFLTTYKGWWTLFNGIAAS